MLSLIGYQFDRVITEERRRLLGIVQGIVFIICTECYHRDGYELGRENYINIAANGLKI